MAAALRGRADVDDALQQAYLRLVNEYERWPADQTAEERVAFAYRAVQLAAKDVLRQQFGRSDRAPRPREVAVDFSADSRNDGEGSAADAIQLLAQERLSETASRYPGDEEHLDNALKVAALAALDPIAHRIVTASQLGLNHKQVAEELGLTHQTVRAKDSEARALLLSLIACARGRDIREATDINLFGYLEGQRLGRAERRLVQAHLKHCADCQAIAALRTEVEAVAQRLALPLPALVGARATLGHLIGGTTSKVASLGANGSSVGSSSAAFGGGAPGCAGLASLSGGKLVTGLAVLALVGTGGSAAIARHQRSGRSAAVVANAARTTSLANSPAKILVASVPSSPRTDHLKRHHAHHHRDSTRPRPASSLRRHVAAGAPSGSPPPVPSVPPQSPPPSAPPSASSGGEFVLGGGR